MLARVRLLLLPLVAVLVALLAGGCASADQAAKVNGAVVSRAAVDRELEDIAANKGYVSEVLEGGGISVKGAADGTYDARVVTFVLNQQVTYALIGQELARRNRPVTADDRAGAQAAVAARYVGARDGSDLYAGFPERYKQVLIERQAELDALRASVGKVDLSQAGLRKAYDADITSYRTTCVSHILWTDPNGQAEAAAAREQVLAAGTLDAQVAAFQGIARAQSKDPGSAQSGGSLQCPTDQALDQFVPEFAAATKALGDGQLSPPVRTQYGYHLIFVTRRSAQAFDKVQATVRDSLLEPSAADFDALITKLKADGKVSINKRFGRWDTSDPTNLHVVAPSTPPTTVAPKGAAPVAPSAG